MFGLYRTMLALCVMAFHLIDVPTIGAYAVFSFFILSGFLMTTIMHDTYRYDLPGLVRYVQNRFLRLYPMYWAAAILSLVVILIASAKYSSAYKDCLTIPHDLPSILFNIGMIYPSAFPYDISPRLSPPSWALTVEIFFYACIGLGSSKSKGITLLWVLGSVVYYIYSYATGLDEAYRFAFILGASLPFSLGSLLYYIKADVFGYIKNLGIDFPLIPLALYVANAAFFSIYAYQTRVDPSAVVVDAGKYINIAISMIVVVSLFYRGKDLFSKRLDKMLGDYSYPIYLSHWQAGLLASYILYAAPSRGLNHQGIMSFLLTICIVCMLSFIFIELIDKKIAIIRGKVKSAARNEIISAASPDGENRECGSTQHEC